MNTTTIRLRDHRGRFTSMHTDDTIIDAEIIEDTSTDLVPLPAAELAIIPDQPVLISMLFEDALASRMPTQMHGYLRTIEILYPEMAQPVGRTIAFDWPVCPTYTRTGIIA